MPYTSTGSQVDAAVAAVMAFDRAASSGPRAAPEVHDLNEVVARLRAKRAGQDPDASVDVPPPPVTRADGARFIRF